MKTNITDAAKRLISSFLLKNFWYRLFAIFLALLIWGSMKVNNDFMRTKVIELPASAITMYGYQTISDKQLIAVNDDLTQLIPDGLRVSVRVPNRLYGDLDASALAAQITMGTNIAVGEQTLPVSVQLTSFSYEAQIVSFSPQNITLELDRFMSIDLPIEADTAGAVAEDHWDESTILQSQNVVKIAGPASIVSQIRRAVAVLDVTGASTTVQQLCDVRLERADGEAVPAARLSVDPSRVTLEQGIYPMKTVPLSVTLVGDVKTDHQLVRAEPSAKDILVIADQAVLDTIDHVETQQILIEGKSESFATDVKVRFPAGVDGMFQPSPTEVQVSVTISEIQSERTYDNLPIRIVGAEASMKTTILPERTSVRISGPVTLMRRMKSTDLSIFVDVGGLTAGRHSVPLYADSASLEELMIIPSANMVDVLIEPTSTSAP